MQALRMYLTPQAKKQRVSGDTDEDIEEDDDISGMGAEDSYSGGEMSEWLQEQKEMKVMMTKMMSMIESIQANTSELKDDVANLKLQVNMAQSTAEEALEISGHFEERMTEIEDKLLDKQCIQNMIDESIAKQLQQTMICRVPTTNTNNPGANSEDDKFSRMVVVGGFGENTEKKEVVNFINEKFLKDIKGVDAYTFGSVGFIRFVSKDAMWEFVKMYQNNAKPQINGKDLWVSTSKSPADRKKAKYLGKFKRVLIEVGLANPQNIRINYRRGIAYVQKIRVAEWMSATEKLGIDQPGLTETGVIVDVKKVEDAVEELVRK